MPNKTFLDFQQKTELASGDYIVGYKADGTAEFRAALSDLAQYVFDYTVPTYSLEAGSASADEGTSVTFTLSTAFVRNGTVIPYTITGINAEDLESGTLTGNFVVNNNNTASQVLALSADQFTEGTETLILTLGGITPTVSAALVINDISTTPAPPTYDLYFRDGVTGEPSLSANEGDYRLLVLQTTNVSSGTIIPFTITGVSQEDLDLLLTDVFTTDHTEEASLGFTLAEDFLTEGPETMVVTLDGIAPTVSAALVINDTSTTPPVPTYNLGFTNVSEEPITTINENETVHVVLTTTNIPPETTIPFTITGVSQSDLENSLTQAFSILSVDESTNTCVWVRPVRPLPDNLTEGPETMVVTLDGITPTVSAALVINDTSTTP